MSVISLHSLQQPATTWEVWLGDLDVLYGQPLHRPATLRKHRGAVRHLRAVCDRPGRIDALAIARLVQRLHFAGLRPASINSILRCIRAQCRVLVAQGILQTSPFSARSFMLPAAPADYMSRRHLTFAEIGRVLHQADVDAQADHAITMPRCSRLWRARRLRALVYLLAFTGLRRNEALQLRRVDCRLDGDVGIIDVSGQTKTAASRQPVPIVEPALTVLRQWLADLGDASPWVFPQASNPQCYWRNSSPRYTPSACLRRLGERAGVFGVNAQIFRHSLATHAESRWGMSPCQIQRILRHTTPATQRHYRHADVDNLRQIGRMIRFDATAGEGEHG